MKVEGGNFYCNIGENSFSFQNQIETEMIHNRQSTIMLPHLNRKLNSWFVYVTHITKATDVIEVATFIEYKTVMKTALEQCRLGSN